MNERDGVVVLSENAGAHEELGDWTLTVNPFDIEGQAEGALRGPDDAARRSAGDVPRRSPPTCASTTSRPGSTTSSPTSGGFTEVTPGSRIGS